MPSDEYRGSGAREARRVLRRALKAEGRRPGGVDGLPPPADDGPSGASGPAPPDV